jgi:hypothetical protein
MNDPMQNLDMEGQNARWINMVREGMQVVDSQGEKVGKVAYVKIGDPETATTQGNEMSSPDTIGTAIAQPINSDEPKVAGGVRNTLVRKGFIKIKTGGLFTKNRYVDSECVASVSDDTVLLNVPKDETIAEAGLGDL